MCGIAGIFAYADPAPPVDREELFRIREAMVKRGPDGAGLWISADSRVGLAHRRLAIIDLSEAGAQPMASADGRLLITFNGEIYNFRELRRELEAKGYLFRTQSDTEVLLHLYADRGAEMVHALRGMYAFGIWDAREQTLFLARDPFGIKPLYYADDGNTIRVASQVRALLKSEVVDSTPEPAGHVGFYVWGHVPEPHTLYKGIKALPAGAMMFIDRRRGCRTPKKFFDVSEEFAIANERNLDVTAAQAAERVHAALRDSVLHHLIADVPVGVFLSSGLDSTTLTALAAEMGTGDLRTITLGFNEYRGTAEDETPLAELVAQRYGTRHQTRWVSRADFENDLSHMLEAMDQPSVDGVNAYFVSQAAARSGMKVALSGLGGDELFGGYPSFRQLPIMVNTMRIGEGLPKVGRAFRRMSAPFLKRVTSPKFAGILEYGASFGGAYLLRRSLFMPWELMDIFDSQMLSEGLNDLQTLLRLEETARGPTSDFQKVSALELSWYMRNQLLRDSDWAGMAHSLEIRVPLVDIELFRTVAPLMAKQPVTKRNMARAPAKPLPSAVLNKRKTGFAIPVREWLQPRISPTTNLRGLREWAYRINPPANRKQRMLALVTDAFGGYGGIALYNRDFLRALCGYPGCSEVVALPRIMSRDPESLPSNLSYVTEGLPGKGSYVAALLKLLWRNSRFDLIVCAHINLLPIAYVAHLLTRAPIILVIYGIDVWQPTRSKIANYLVSKVFAYISISKVTEDRFLSWANAGKARRYLLPNAIHLQSYAAGPKDPKLVERFGLAGKRVLLTLGRLVSIERYKGFDEVIEVLPELATEVPDIAYLVVGDGTDLERLKKKVGSLGIEDRVVFTGFVSEQEKPAIYRVADAYVMASRGEGFGFAILEALATGLPTIASKLDGGREAVREGMLGMLVNPDDRAELKLAILEALRRPKGVPDGLEYFSYANFEQRLHAMIDEILNGLSTDTISSGTRLVRQGTVGGGAFAEKQSGH